jgi:Ni/Co efflux regulator RcnB
LRGRIEQGIGGMQRLFLGTAVAVAALAASNGSAQTRVGHAPGASFPRPGVQPVPAYRPTPGYRPVGSRPGTHVSRWGSKVGGHWWGGVNAPGGWGAYRRPARGYVLPRYWVAPRFYVTDWAGYGLTRPPVGYSWSRYYDDAVLIDDRGSIYDTVSGVDWDGEGDAYDDGYAASVYEDRGYERDRRDTGLGGAAVGAVAGGVAGNLIAGRGNRLGGTLIGAGVGAAAGYALDKSEDRGDILVCGRRGGHHRRAGLCALLSATTLCTAGLSRLPTEQLDLSRWRDHGGGHKRGRPLWCGNDDRDGAERAGGDHHDDHIRGCRHLFPPAQGQSQALGRAPAVRLQVTPALGRGLVNPAAKRVRERDPARQLIA